MNLNIKSKLVISIGLLTAMIVLLVVLSVVHLQILTAAEPGSLVAETGFSRAMIWIIAVGGICILAGLGILIKLPASINKPIKKLTDAILEVANHNYDVTLDLKNGGDLENLSNNFNRMVRRLNNYHNSTLSDLMASKRYVETIIDSISELIIGLDNDMNILFINNEALNVLNLKHGDVIRKSAQTIALHNDLLRSLVNGLLNQKENGGERSREKHETLNIYADNKESRFQVKYMDITMKGRDGVTMEKKGDVILLKNITEFHELDAAKTSFISHISHELKNPVSDALMNLQLLRENRFGELSPGQEELSANIKENCERLLHITGELQNMAQIETGRLRLNPKLTGLVELIEYAIKANRVQADKFGIQIEVDYPEEEKMESLFVDSEKIAWVLTNLLSNAIRYSPENNRVIVGVRRAGDNHVEMYVRDFGKGIDPRYHKSIFDHYFRVPGMKVQGSGMGLSISQDFVEAHHGTLSVESEVGQGSMFVIRLRK